MEEGRELTADDIETCRNSFYAYKKQKGLFGAELDEQALKIEYKKVKYK